jgi:CPA2 family monovalent cation:H+ antiporter-2
MPHEVDLIATIAAGFALAMAMGLLATHLKMPPLVGYLVAGILIGPSTPGFVGNLGLASQFGVIALMLIVGRRLLPKALWWVARTGSQELFRLSVVAVALGVAFGAAMLFDVSFALGAFFAGMMLRESEFSHRAAEESLPLRDAFAVLFLCRSACCSTLGSLWSRR